jgi:sulfate permease, SulP family
MLTQLIRSSPPKEPTPGVDDMAGAEDAETDFGSVTIGNAVLSQPHEQTSLLQRDGSGKTRFYGLQGSPEDIEQQELAEGNQLWRLQTKLRGLVNAGRQTARIVLSPKSWNRRNIWKQAVMRPVSCLPAVLLGLLLNILDALSYGMILFPLGQPLFADLGPDGISMFYVSCIVSQLVYSLGGSVFRGGVGSEMIEVVPFFHKMAFTIMQRVGDNPRAILATTVLSYSLSSILTGAIFFLLGQCHLGVLIGFFPRHILIGCIGGVGWFLVATGLEVSAGLDGNLEYNLGTLERLFRGDMIALWIIPLVLALALFVVKRWVRHSLTDAAWFISIILIFYIVVAAIPNLSVADLRGTGWVFEAPAAGVPWWHFYTLYDFSVVDWTAIGETIPAMLALTFFGVLHVPINVPALGLSTGEDNVDVDRELKAHGYSNALSGFAGSIQNYLVYTNTVLFMRSGGDSRLAGVLLAAATFGVLVIGPVIIGFIPVMVVGTLIFFLGLDLMREALLDTIGRVHKLEYLTIIIIVVTMGAYDFVIGILVGIVLACVSFVFQTSQISAIRGTLPGGLASSMVRRHPMQHRFLQEVGRQIYVMKLAGYLFFGTIVGVENSIRAVLRDDAFNSRPIQFLVIDLSKVDGVDFSSAEAFTRINRILAVRDVRLVLSGFRVGSDVGRSLQNVGLLDGREYGVEFFEVLNAALEHCENELLKAFYQQRAAMLNGDKGGSTSGSVPPPSKTLDVPTSAPGSNAAVRTVSSPNFFPQELAFSSPRRGQLHTAAATTLREQERILPPTQWQRQPQPLQLILQTFANFSDQHGLDFWVEAVPFFSRQALSKGTVVYRAGDPPDGFYLLETGILRATYHLLPIGVGTKQLASSGGFTEVIAAGATCGELPFFSDTQRTATVLAERESVVWVLKSKEWERCQKEKPTLATEIMKIGLRLTSERMMGMAKYMLLAGT